jgi:hypothetical protein
MSFVIAGFIKPSTWIPCPECSGVAFWIEEPSESDVTLRVIEGGR